MKKVYLIFSLFLSSITFFSCSDELTLTSVDENAYSNIGKVEAILKDDNTGNTSNIVELRKKDFKSSISINLTKPVNQSLDFHISIDTQCLEDYNKKHNSDFELFPSELVKIGGKEMLDVVVAPKEPNSFMVNLELKSDNSKLEEGKTYFLPLKITSANPNISISERGEHCFYIIKNYISESDCDKGDDMKNFVYFEINDANPLNALEFKREDGKLFFDYVVLFAANITWDMESKRVALRCNPNIQFLLDNSEEYLQPLRKKGIKVLLGVLGNSIQDVAGLAQLSEMGAKEFAKELALYCKTYNLDGVNFDDEYRNLPDLTNPWLAAQSKASASRLIYETKMLMPDKYVTVYYINEIDYDCPDINGVGIGNYVDIAVADYPKVTGVAGTAAPMKGMKRSQCSGMSVELRKCLGDDTTEGAELRKSEGYGYYMWFALDPNFYFAERERQVIKIGNVCRGLYDGKDIITPQYFYKKNDTTRYPIDLLK